jgi:hypothetical protein
MPSGGTSASRASIQTAPRAKKIAEPRTASPSGEAVGEQAVSDGVELAAGRAHVVEDEDVASLSSFGVGYCQDAT